MPVFRLSEWRYVLFFVQKLKGATFLQFMKDAPETVGCFKFGSLRAGQKNGAATTRVGAPE
ncbi:hypothetical protein ACI01nite_10680 [Acetobacter cibinongensis]|uniref:Uncharacterized protein n=1 Tax=Acetobacter cibinongensis TaxID=146475 RepID=A0A0D6N4V1_9PROT|nr:hypothetical protein Abci_017_221 [Acetobacter cibinongensis]GBQ12911.1 hypothetical protein AA0482_0411 [Acetobacter cibinongensis NRIC 0482]GEL58466.1 hypothetical protein ACI01nite_10680 [Acetobacter cibinongensis]